MLQHGWKIVLLYLIFLFFIHHGRKIAPVLYIYPSTGTENNTVRPTALGTLRHQDTSALNYSAEVTRHFGTDLYETLRHHCIAVGLH